MAKDTPLFIFLACFRLIWDFVFRFLSKMTCSKTLSFL